MATEVKRTPGEDIPALLEEIAELQARIEVEREAWRIAREKAVYQYQQASQLRLVCHNIWDHCSVIANDLRGADAIKELLELLNRKEMGEPEVQP